MVAPSWPRLRIRSSRGRYTNGKRPLGSVSTLTRRLHPSLTFRNVTLGDKETGSHWKYTKDEVSMFFMFLYPLAILNLIKSSYITDGTKNYGRYLCGTVTNNKRQVFTKFHGTSLPSVNECFQWTDALSGRASYGQMLLFGGLN